MDQKELNFKALSYIDQYQSLISLVIFILILGFGYFLILGPLYKSVNEEIKTAKLTNEKIYNEKNKTFNLLSGIFDGYNKVDPVLKAKIDKILPDEDGFVSIFPQFEYIIVKNGFLIKSIEGRKAEDNAGQPAVDATQGNNKNVSAPISHLGKYNIKLSITNIDYNGTKRLLSILENNIRLMDINNLSFLPDQRKVDLDITTYYWKN